MSTVALQTQSQPAGPLSTVGALLNKYKEQIAMALPKHLTPERMIRVALTAVSRSDKLQQCSPATIAGCVVQASILGLEPDGVLGEAYLVPFWNAKAPSPRGGNAKGAYECQLIPGYQGLLKLVRNSGELKMVDVQEVCQNDEFDFEKGMEPFLRHKPAMGERGAVTHYWAGAVLQNGGKQFEVMTKEEIELHRDKFSKAKDFGPWRDSPEWMFKKTVLRKLIKLLPKSAQAQMAVALDERAEVGIPQRFAVDVPIDLQQTDIEGEHEHQEPGQLPQRLSEKTEPAAETSTDAPADTKKREESEAKALRKKLQAKYEDRDIEKHTKGRDINAVKSLDELIELENSLAEDSDIKPKG